MDSTFPLSEHFFPPLFLSQRRLLYLRAQADKVVQQALEQCTTLQHARVSTASKSSGKPSGSYGNGTTIRVSQAFSSIQATCTDVIRCFKSETREEYFNSQKTQFAITTDADVLHTVPQSSRASELSHEAIKWAAYELFPFRARADSCQYEATGERVDANGQAYAFHVVIPAIFPEVPAFSRLTRTVRIFSTRVVVARPNVTASSNCDVFLRIQNDFQSRRVCQSMENRFQFDLDSLRVLLSSGRAASQWRFVRRAWVPAKPPAGCSHCLKLFSILRASRNCVACRRLVCRSCLIRASEVVDTAREHHHHQDLHAKLCIPCVNLLRENQRQAVQTVVVPARDDTIHYLRLSETPANTAVKRNSNWTVDRKTHRTRSAQPARARRHPSSQEGWVTTPPQGEKHFVPVGHAAGSVATSPPLSCSSTPLTYSSELLDLAVSDQKGSRRPGSSLKVQFTIDMRDMARVHHAGDAMRRRR